jgi:hypothetical protein
MAVATTVIDRLESPPAAELISNPEPRRLVGIAVHEGNGVWTALCTDLDIAVIGNGADDALVRLQAAVADAIALANERGLSAGNPVPEDAVAELLRSHQPTQGAAVVLQFPV